MNLKKIGALVAVMALATAALAGEEIHSKISIAVIGSDDGSDVRFEFDGDDLGFNLHDLQEGENRSIVDKEGRNVLITREADGFRFDVDGKTIKLPAIEHHADGAVWIDGDDMSSNVDVRIVRDAKFIGEPGNGVTVISGEPIDETTQQAIQSLLQSAGHDVDVQFIDGERRYGGVHGVKVIERRVEKTE